MISREQLERWRALQEIERLARVTGTHARANGHPAILAMANARVCKAKDEAIAAVPALIAEVEAQAKEIERLRAALTSASAKPCELSVRGKYDSTCQEFYAARGELWCAACIARAALKETP